VRQTIDAMQTLARRTVAAKPDALLLISPHSPQRTGAFGIWWMPRLRGTLREFGAEEDGVDLPFDREMAEKLEQAAAAREQPAWRIRRGELDHGATVPLGCLAAAGWTGPTVVIGLRPPGEGGQDETGRAIAAAAQSVSRRLALIASGDMSHRLTVSAPGGFHPDGRRFDHAFITALRSDERGAVLRVDPALAETAAEDVADSTRVALAAVGFATEGRVVLSYEGPFGVGYGVAVLFEPRSRVLSRGADLPMVARCAVAAELEHGADEPPFVAGGELRAPHGVFVTVRTVGGELRGCIGSPFPGPMDLVRSVWQEARAAAFHDPRFEPVRRGELAEMRFTVSVLGGMEPVASAAELAPSRYGVLVTAADGRRGLLLPAVEGIRSVADQLSLAKR
jgi:AmmeMemoRadiSam system protein A